MDSYLFCIHHSLPGEQAFIVETYVGDQRLQSDWVQIKSLTLILIVKGINESSTDAEEY